MNHFSHPVKDRAGTRCGKLVGVRREPARSASGEAVWVWACDCSSTKTAAYSLAYRVGHCGCENKRKRPAQTELTAHKTIADLKHDAQVKKFREDMGKYYLGLARKEVSYALTRYGVRI